MDIKIIGKQSIAGFSFTGIEGGFGEGKKAMLVKEIADIHEQPLKEINRRINTNINRFKFGSDIIDLKNGGFEPPLLELGFSSRDISISNNIYILSERGYAKLLKILEDDKAWELYDQFVDGYFNMRSKLDTSQLSPELQMFNKLFNTLASQELEQKQLKTEMEQTRSEVKEIREIVALNSRDWRKDVNQILNDIAKKHGGYDQYKIIRNESYQVLEQRANALLNIRVTNKKKKMAFEGVAKSKIDKVSKLDVIDEDKRLLEIYLAVVKEMAIRYQVEVKKSS